MNEKLNLVEILKDCPKGTKFYSTIYGEVEVAVFWNDANYPIRVFCPTVTQGIITPLCKLSKDGKYNNQFDGECTLFPSKEQRDWSKFKIPQKEKFDPKTLKPFDKVLIRDRTKGKWSCSLFSHIDNELQYHNVCTNGLEWKFCIPYNDDTKHLVGTTDEAPEFYRYWKD